MNTTEYKVKIYKKKHSTTMYKIIKGILYFFLIIGLLGTVVGIPVIFFLFPGQKACMSVDSMFNTTITNKKVRLQFNMVQLYRLNKVTVKNNTYSDTISIEITDIDGYDIDIDGNTTARDGLIALCQYHGINYEENYDNYD